MAFFKNVKTIFSASVSVLGDATELMAGLAEDLQRETKILALRAEIKNLEFFVQNPDMHQSSDRVGLRKQLFEKYDELSSLLGEHGKKEVEDRKSSFLEAERIEQEQALDARIATMEARVKKGGYKLPVEEKLALSRLLDSYEQLFKLNERRRTAELVGRTHELKVSIDELEASRRRIQEDFFTSGSKKSLIPFLDEKKDGVSEYWYENGMRKARIEFKSGLAHGKCLVWYEDGALELDALYRQGRICSPSSVYSSNGVKVLGFQEDFVRLRMWNGAYLGRYRVGSNVFLAKLCILLRVLFSFKALRGFYRAQKGGSDNLLLVECNRVVLAFSSGMADVSVWLES